MSKDGLLKITIAKWFTPKDKNIDKQGIAPDIEVDFEEEDYDNLYDRQLEIAKEVLRDFISTKNFDSTIEKFNKETAKEEE
jgi:C-terminal processing protease CtpA/Prc